jgi:hypothetical protein
VLKGAAALAGYTFYPMGAIEGIRYALDKMPHTYIHAALTAVQALVVTNMAMAAFDAMPGHAISRFVCVSIPSVAAVTWGCICSKELISRSVENTKSDDTELLRRTLDQLIPGADEHKISDAGKHLINKVLKKLPEAEAEGFLTSLYEKKPYWFAETCSEALRHQYRIPFQQLSTQLIRKLVQVGTEYHCSAAMDLLLGEWRLSLQQKAAAVDEYGQRSDCDPSNLIRFFKFELFEKPELMQELSEITLGKLLQFNNPLFFSMGKLLDMTASDPVKQLQILEHRPLDVTYINSTEYQGYEYPRLAEGTMDHLMLKPSVWDAAFCSRQRKDLGLDSFTDDQLLLLAECTPYGNRRQACEEEWQSSLIKLALESLPDNRAVSFLKKLGPGSVWFKFVLRQVLVRNANLLDEKTLLEWIAHDWELALIIINVRPDLYKYVFVNAERTKDIEGFLDPEILVKALPFPLPMIRVYSYRVLDRTTNKAWNIAKDLNASDAIGGLETRLRFGLLYHGSLGFLIEGNKPFFDPDLLQKHTGFGSALNHRNLIQNLEENKERLEVFYKTWHSNDTHYFPLEFFLDIERCTRIDFPTRGEEALLWIASESKKEQWDRAPEYVQEFAKMYPQALGNILGLWGLNLRISEMCYEAFNMVTENGMKFRSSYRRSLFDTFKHYIHYRNRFGYVTNDWSALYLGLEEIREEPMIQDLSSLLAEKKRSYSVLNLTGSKTICSRDVVQCLSPFLSVRDLLRLARTCRGMYRYICTAEGEPLWRKFGSLQTVALYHMIPQNDQSQEALIMRKALLRNNPQLYRLKYA